MTIPLISKYCSQLFQFFLVYAVFHWSFYPMKISKNLWLSDVFGINRVRPNKLEPKVPKELDKTKKGFLSSLVF